MAKQEQERQMVFTTRLVDEATDKINDGIVIKRFQNPWLKSEVGLRRAGVSFRMSPEEQEEYIKCALNVDYFTEKYCKVKTEDGSIDHIQLRDYQEEILENFVKNRFNILMASRQVGKTISSAIFMLHTILFNNDKNIMIVANKGDTAVEIVDKIKSIYTLLPFFLKPGIKTWNQKSLTFENGCRIKTSARSKTPAIGFTIDVLYLDEFAHIPSNIIEPYYTAAFPTVSAVQNSKIIITSTPNGMNLFHKLLTDAERPDGDPLKNNYKPMRVYWHQVPGRFVTYIRLNEHKLYEYGVTKEQIYELVDGYFGDKTKLKMGFNMDLQKNVISVFNNEQCTDEDVKSLSFIDSKGLETPIRAIAELTTWKEEAIKDIGGEDAFNQEYGLRFINSSKSLLSEAIIENLLNSKKNYVFEEMHEFESKLRFSYKDLRWVDDDNLFMPINRKNEKFILSVDISEGLGQDYSIINIFKIAKKSNDLIEQQKMKYKSITDFFKLEQVGLFRSNLVSVKQLAELLYVLAYDYLNPENVKIVLELNNYGNTLLAEMPHVFDGNNDYGSSIFFRYKHRVDATEEKVGLKVGDNKNMMVKDYQDLMISKGFSINNEETIREITTFVKQTTTSGNTRYAADVGHDDCLLPNTLIKTINGYKKIKDIKLGEFVLTHLGNNKKETNICIREFDGDMYNVKFRGQLALDITYNHPIYIATENYSRKEYKRGNYNNFKVRKWLLPSEITKKQRGVSIIEELNNKNVTIKYEELFNRDKNCALSNIKLKEIKLDDKFSKFLGLFLADGNCYKPNKTTYRISLAFNSNQTDLIEEMRNYFTELGIKSHLEINGNSTVMISNNRTLFELLIMCYDSETKEKILPSYSSKIGNNLSHVLDYWLKGDGWKYEKKGRTKSMIGCSTSIQLALSMRDIASSLGKHAIISKKERYRYNVKCKDQYWVHIYNKRPETSVLKKISNFEYSSNVEKIEKYNYKGVTYNLEVEDDNSYIANGIVVHNCVMTIVNATSVFNKNDFKEMCEDLLDKDSNFKTYVNECLRSLEYTETVDYGQLLKVRRQYINKSRNNNNSWFGK